MGLCSPSIIILLLSVLRLLAVHMHLSLRWPAARDAIRFFGTSRECAQHQGVHRGLRRYLGTRLAGLIHTEPESRTALWLEDMGPKSHCQQEFISRTAWWEGSVCVGEGGKPGQKTVGCHPLSGRVTMAMLGAPGGSQGESAPSAPLLGTQVPHLQGCLAGTVCHPNAYACQYFVISYSVLWVIVMTAKKLRDQGRSPCSLG